MRGSRAYAALVVGLVILHFTLRPLLVRWPGTPDLLVGALLLAGLRYRPGATAALGFLLGLLEGSMALEGMGATTAVYTLVGYAGARARELLFVDARAFVPLFLFAGVWLAEVALAAAGSDVTPGLALLTAPLAGATTALVCWLAVRAFPPVSY